MAEIWYTEKSKQNMKDQHHSYIPYNNIFSYNSLKFYKQIFALDP